VKPIELSFEVACSPAHAFDTWTTRIDAWWPRSHSVTADPCLHVAVEPFPGGRIFERTPAGEEHDWGAVLAYEPPRRFAYTWHLRQDRADATDVEITFEDAPGGTRVTIVHDGWERLGGDKRERNRRGWESLLPHYRAVLA
jgi:uncharacterized protein YndB with AHSA1/START domain